MAVTHDGGDSYSGVHLYKDIGEVSYATSQNGTGTRANDAAADLWLGNACGFLS